MSLDYDRPLRLRFAPSPTGTLHVGGARTALFNYLLARRTRGALVLRIDDTDTARNRTESERALVDDLRWLGLSWHEGPDLGGPDGPYRQSERLPRYAEHAAELLAAGAAYPCYCTPEELEAEREAQRRRGISAPQYSGRCRSLGLRERAALECEGRVPALRFAVPPGETVVDDLVKGRVVFDHAAFGDFVVRKADGGPTYNFASPLDDALMRIDLVLRGDEHLSNTPPQLMVLRALGLPIPRFAHVPLILNEAHQKLSKRHDTVGLDAFRAQGYLPQALVNHLALLGWSPGDDREEFTLDELAAVFSVERIGTSPAVFNAARLRAFNRRALQRLPRAEYLRLLAETLARAGLPAGDDPETRALLETFVEAYGDELHSLGEAVPIVRELQAPAVRIPDGERERLRAAGPYLAAVARYLAGRADLHALPLAHDLPAIAAEFGLKRRDAYHLVRVALTGKEQGPPLQLLIPLIGRERAVDRLAAPEGGSGSPADEPEPADPRAAAARSEATRNGGA